MTSLHIQTGNNVGSSWGISSIFGSNDNRSTTKEHSTSKQFIEPVQTMEQGISMIHLREVYPLWSSVACFGDVFSLPSNWLCYYFISLLVYWGPWKPTQNKRLWRLLLQSCCWDHIMISYGRTSRIQYQRLLCIFWYSNFFCLGFSSISTVLLFFVNIWLEMQLPSMY